MPDCAKRWSPKAQDKQDRIFFLSPPALPQTQGLMNAIQALLSQTPTFRPLVFLKLSYHVGLKLTMLSIQDTVLSFFTYFILIVHNVCNVFWSFLLPSLSHFLPLPQNPFFFTANPPIFFLVFCDFLSFIRVAYMGIDKGLSTGARANYQWLYHWRKWVSLSQKPLTTNGSSGKSRKRVPFKPWYTWLKIDGQYNVLSAVTEE